MTEQQPVLSIVTPSYNQADFLAEALSSVLSQEGEFHLDCVVVDGGSTDRSPEILRNFAEMIEAGNWPIRCRGIRYRWISEEDQGQADALAKGFRLAEGDILAWLNSDDVYLPGVLQKVAKFFRDHPETALYYGAAYFCDTSGKIDGKYPTAEFDLSKLARTNFFCQPSTFFRKEAFLAVGGLDRTLRFAMDYDLFIRIAHRLRCQYDPTVFSKYRLHADAKTVRSDTLRDNHEETLRVVRKHYGWAPLNLVYGSCYYSLLAQWPSALPRFRPLAIAVALLSTFVRSLWLNRGLRREDLQLLSVSNIRKLFRDRSEILRG